MPAAHVGHARAAFQKRLDAFERRNPLAHQVGRVAGPEEALGAMEQGHVVLVPADAQARAHGLDHLGNDLELRHGDLERTGHEGRAAFLGQREGLFLGQREQLALRVVFNVAAGGLGRQPFAQVARVGLGAAGELLRGGGAFGQRLVQAELVADDDGGRVHHGPDVVDEVTHERVKPCFVDGHVYPLRRQATGAPAACLY
ncbi:hypothetical protein D9M69_492420 [compost metagenome]